MKVDIWTPLPPTESGIAHYADAVFAPGMDGLDIEFSTSTGSVRRADALPVYQLGNNPHHEFVFEAALERPGVIEIHDFSLHHLVTELTLARGDMGSYLNFMSRSAGEPGRLLALKRLNNHFHPRLEFELPLLEPFVETAQHIIVHSRWARERVRMMRRAAPVSLIPHFCLRPEDSGLDPSDRENIRKRYGISKDETAIVCAGFVTEPKRLPWILEALRVCQNNGFRNFRLIIAGEVQNTRYLDAIQDLPDQKCVKLTGFLSDREFDELFLAADVVPVLRWPSVGESSGVASRAMGFGATPLILRNKSFADFPDKLAEFIELSSEAEIIQQLILRFTAIFSGKTENEAIRKNRAAYAEKELGLPAVRQTYRELLTRLCRRTF